MPQERHPERLYVGGAAGERGRAHLAPLSQPLRGEILELWDEYEAAATPEARLAKALDKLETILQHTQGDNPPDFDYRFNLGYGREYTAGDPLIETIRRILDEETERRAEEADGRTDAL